MLDEWGNADIGWDYDIHNKLFAETGVEELLDGVGVPFLNGQGLDDRALLVH